MTVVDRMLAVLNTIEGKIGGLEETLALVRAEQAELVTTISDLIEQVEREVFERDRDSDYPHE